MPTITYEHINPCTTCHLGRKFQLFRQSLSLELKVCDSCSQPIRIATEVLKNPLLDAAKTYGPGNIPLPPPMSHPVPGTPPQPPVSPNTLEG